MPSVPSSNEQPGGKGSDVSEPLLSVLETNMPLSQSLIWQRQRDFYARRGLKAWSEDQVPAYITNNPFFADVYAGIVFGFLRDCMEHAGRRAPSLETPLRLIELGAGTGKFAYLFLRRLTALLQSKDIPCGTVRYCMTDCAQTMLDAWRSNSYLAQFVDDGILEFGLFQAGAQHEVHRLNQFQKNGNAAASLVVLIANYVFDSLPQDAFVIKGGEIFEARVTTSRPGLDIPAGLGLSDLKLSFGNFAITETEKRYAHPAWNAILEHYRATLPAATVLFPVQALTIMEDLAKLSDGRMLVLAADKGQAYEDQILLSQSPPIIEFHSPDCFSTMVNFHALGQYIESVGGSALLPDKHFSRLNVCAFLKGDHDERFPNATAAYRQAQAAFGPDDLFTLFAWLNTHVEEMSVSQALAALRLTRWDTTAFTRMFPIIARQARTASAERHDLRDAVLRVWGNHYPLSDGDNILAFNCGVILLELRYFQEAMTMFRTSQTTFAPSAATSYNLGLCALGLNRKPEALAFMIEACNLDSAFEPARVSRDKLQAGN